MSGRERTSRGGKQLWSSLPEFRRWNDHAYGVWTCVDGREVVFNRFYEPLLQRRPGGPVEAADPREWVPGIVQRRWFYDDGSPPTETGKVRAAEAALRAGGWRP